MPFNCDVERVLFLKINYLSYPYMIKLPYVKCAISFLSFCLKFIVTNFATL